MQINISKAGAKRMVLDSSSVVLSDRRRSKGHKLKQ